MLAPSQIPVSWRGVPFVGPVRTALRPAGLSIAELVASVPDLPRRFATEGHVAVNGVVVPRAMWGHVRPRVRHDFEVVVTLHLPTLGGGGGQGGGSKNPIATVAAIALLVVTAAISGGALGPAGLGWFGAAFGAGKIGAILAATAVGVAGSLAIAALAPPPVQAAASQAGQGDATGDDDPTPSSASGNVLAKGASFPRVLGEMNVYPAHMTPPLVESVGTDTYVEAVYALAGPHRFRNIKIGETLIENVPDLQYQVVEGKPGDAIQTLVQRQAVTDSPQIEFSRPEINSAAPSQLKNQLNPSQSLQIWHAVASRKEPDEIWMALAFQEGLVDLGSPSTKIGVPLRFQFRRKGETAWRNGPEIHFASSGGPAAQKLIKFKWQASPLVQPSPPDNEGPYLAFNAVPGQTAFYPVTGGWVADPYFNSGAGSACYASSTYMAHSVRNISLNQDGVEVFFDPAQFPKGVYEFQFLYGQVYNANNLTTSYTYFGLVYDLFGFSLSGGIATLPRTRAQIHDKVILSNVTSVWNENPVPLPGLATISIRAKNRRVENLSVIAGGLVRDWNGTDWGDLIVTDNPAPHYRDVQCGDLNADPLPIDLSDDAELLTWRQDCITKGYKVNALIESGSVNDARALIASCGYARPYQSELWGVARDRDRTGEIPVQIFSPRNLSAFHWEKAFPKLPDGLRCIFTDKDNDYTQGERIVYRKGIDPASANRLEEMQYAGLVTDAEVSVRGAFDLAQMTARTTFYYGTADVESIVCRRNSLVGVSHDTLSHWAGSARIKSVVRDGTNVTGLVLDGSIPAAPANFIAGHDGSIMEALKADPTSFLFAAPGVVLLTGRQQGSFLTPRRFLKGRRSGVAIRRSDGSVVAQEILLQPNGSDELMSVTFATPIADAGNLIQPDNLIVSGLVGQEYKRLIVFGIRPAKDLTADLIFVDEAPQLWT